MRTTLKTLGMLGLLAGMLDGIMHAEPVYNTRMKKKDPTKPGPSKAVREARKRQKAARKQNRKR